MLVKGTLESNVLSTEMGQFHISPVHDRDEYGVIKGVFELSHIKPSSLDKAVTVDGYETYVKIPIVHAVVVNYYAHILVQKSAELPHRGKQEAVVSQNVSNNVSEPSEDLLSSSSEVQNIVVEQDNLESSLVEKSCDETDDCSVGDNNQHLAEDVEILGKPLSEFGDTYQLDPSLKRDVIKQIFVYLKKRGAAFNAKSQSWDLAGVLS